MRGVKTIFQYAIGDGKVTTGILTATLFATHIGAGSTIGVVETIYKVGMLFVVTSIAGPFFWLIMLKVFGNNIEKFRNAGCITISDVMEYLYGPTARWVTNIGAAMMSVSIIGMQILAMGYLFEFFFSVNPLLGSIIGCGVVVLYSILGGIKAVVITDAMQALILGIAIPVACFIGYNDVGGFDGLRNLLPETHQSVEWSTDNIIYAIGCIVWASIASYGSFIQRFLMTNNTKQLRQSFVALFFITIPFTITIFLIGFIVKAKAPDINPNTALYYLIDHYLPMGVKGFVIAGLLAAIMSTADSWLNTASVLFAHDIMKKLFPSMTDRGELNCARAGLVVIALLAAFSTFYHHESVLKLDLLACNFWNPIIYIPIALGFMGYIGRSTTFKYSSIGGIIGTTFGAYVWAKVTETTDLFNFDAVSLVCGLLGCGIVFTICELRGKKWFFGHKIQITACNTRLYKDFALNTSKTFCKHFIDVYRQNTAEMQEKCYYIGFFGIIYYLLSSFAFTLTGNIAQDIILWLRVVALFLCLVLSIHEVYLSQKSIKKYMPIFLHVAIIYCLPFLSIYTLFISKMSYYWAINCILSAALLYVLSNNLYVFLVSLAFGGCAACLLFFNLDSGIFLQIDNYANILIFVTLISTLAIMYLVAKKETQKSLEIKAKVLYGQSMAHEVKQPIASIYMASSVFEDILNHQQPSDISQENFNLLKDIAKSFGRTSQKSVNTVNMLFNILAEDVSNAKDKGWYSANFAVTQAISDYSLSDDDKARIVIHKANDFHFYGSMHFVKHVISNLLSNAIRYAGNGVKIEIWYECHNIHFKDYGVGISKSQIQNIFKTLKNPDSIFAFSGIGLSFCNDVMTKMGGHITCYSEEGKFTEMIISFPST